MIPIRDDSPQSRWSAISLSLVAISVAVFAIELKWSAQGQLGQIWQTWGLVGDRFWQALSTVFETGNLAASVAWLVFSVPCLWTSLFLHASFSQILGNLLFFWVFARRLEALWGPGRFLVFYLGCGGLTSAIQALLGSSTSTPLIGANGAIAAILGAYWVLFPTAKIDSLYPWGFRLVSSDLPVGFYGVWWFAQQLLYGIGGLNSEVAVNSWGFAYWIHGCGLLVGGGFALLAKHWCWENRAGS